MAYFLRSSRSVGGSSTKYRVRQSLKDKTFLVTGASSGIGKELVETLAKRKARVIMACRDMNKCRVLRRDIVLDSGNKHVVCRHLDLASCESIKKFTEKMIRDENVDVLINNAGLVNGKKRKITKDGFEEMLGVNYLGHFLLTMLLIDRMLQRDVPVRIINLSGLSHPNENIDWEDFNRVNSYNENYKAEVWGQGNLCKIMWTRLLAKRLEGTKITVNAVYPGMCYTNLYSNLSHQGSSINYVTLLYKFVEEAEGLESVNTSRLNLFTS